MASACRLRDVLIHQYEGVDLERVWAVVERDLPRVRTGIRPLLPHLDALERELAGETLGSADFDEDGVPRA